MLTDETRHHPIPWYEAPVPPRWHRCKAATTGEINFSLVERCACGGLRRDGRGPWIERNTRKRKD